MRTVVQARPGLHRLLRGTAKQGSLPDPATAQEEEEPDGGSVKSACAGQLIQVSRMPQKVSHTLRYVSCCRMLQQCC